jgi:hypothetical protein
MTDNRKKDVSPMGPKERLLKMHEEEIARVIRSRPSPALGAIEAMIARRRAR